MFNEWYEKNQNVNFTLFVDYDLSDKECTGLDIITRYKHIRSYLVTDHAEEKWLQELADKDKFKLIPKSLIKALQFIKI